MPKLVPDSRLFQLAALSVIITSSSSAAKAATMLARQGSESMSVDVPNTPEVERLTRERDSRREAAGTWDTWNLGFIALAGIAALGLVVTGLGVSRSNKRLNNISEELGHAKDLESEREALAAKERTARLEEEAESERLARMKIEAKIAPRRLTALQKNRFAEILKPFSSLGQVNLLLINTADDSPDLASDFADAMQGAGVRTQISVLAGGEYFKGVYLQSGVDRLKEADAIGSFLLDVGLSREPVTITHNAPPEILTIRIGAKPE